MFQMNELLFEIFGVTSISHDLHVKFCFMLFQ
jgi:hypothetical protein